MTCRTLLLAGAVAAAFATPQPARAAEPFGDWLVAEKTAHIRVLECGGALFGVVAWEKDPGGVDEKNPDPAKRSRPTLGMPILLGMKPVNGGWDGPIYNSENGKTYAGGVRMNKAGTLHIFGCIFRILCGGENWTRVKAPTQGGLDATGDALCARLGEP